MSRQTVERYLMLFNLLSESTRGLTRGQLKQLIPDYRDTAIEASFARKFERDKAVLREVGLLEEATENTDGDDYRYRAVAVNRQQFAVLPRSERGVVTLLMAARAWNSGGISKILHRALTKLGWLVPQQAAEVGTVFSTSLVEPAGLLPTARALVENRALSFGYRTDKTGSDTARLVQVLGLGRRFGRWYVFGQDSSAAGAPVKAYRLDRMRNIKLGDTHTYRQQVIDMDRALADISRSQPARVLVEDSRGRRSRVKSYSLEETVADALVHTGRVLAVSHEDDSQGADYQQRARDLYLDRLNRLCLVHSGRAVVPADLKWTTSIQQRRRLSAEDTTLKLLSIAHYAQLYSGISIKELAQYFGMGASAMRDQLNFLNLALGESNYGFYEDDDGVHVRTGARLQQAVQLSRLEIFLLFVTLTVLYEGSSQTAALDDAIFTLGVLASGDGDIVQRVKVYAEEGSVTAFVREAVEDRVALRIRYRGRNGETERIIVPLEVFTDLGTVYVRAFCCMRQQTRNFRVDRIELLDELNSVPESRTPPSGDSSSGGVLGAMVGDEGGRGKPLLPQDWARQVQEHAVVRLARTTGDDHYISSLALESARAGEDVYYRLPVAHGDWVVEIVARYGGEVELVEPAWLRGEIEQRYSDLQKSAA